MKRRRTFLTETGLGFTGLALGAMLRRDGVVQAATEGWRPPDGKPHFAPKAKRVIWLFMIGGASQMETFDPKPALNKYAGKTIAETPFKDTAKQPVCEEESAGSDCRTAQGASVDLSDADRVSEARARAGWKSAIGSRMWAVASTTSRWCVRCGRPTTTTARSCSFTPAGMCSRGSSRRSAPGSTTGSGSLNENLPQFVVLGEPIDSCCGGPWAHGAHYLGPEHDGVQLKVDAEEPAAVCLTGTGRFPGRAGARVCVDRQAEPRDRKFNTRTTRRCAPGSSPTNWLSACRRPCRTSCAWTAKRKPHDKCMGWTRRSTQSFGEICLSARRLVEQGTRFVQISTAQRRRGRLGRALQSEDRPREALPAGGQTDRRFTSRI